MRKKAKRKRGNPESFAILDDLDAARNGWPVLSSQLSPGAAPQVGQGTESASFGLTFFSMAEKKDDTSNAGARNI